MGLDMSLDNIVQLTEANITAAKEHLAEIEAARGLLQKAGMYPAAPHFQWQRREELGEARYLYLMFHKNQPQARPLAQPGEDTARHSWLRKFVHLTRVADQIDVAANGQFFILAEADRGEAGFEGTDYGQVGQQIPA